jgi:hypothetical protein
MAVIMRHVDVDAETPLLDAVPPFWSMKGTSKVLSTRHIFSIFSSSRILSPVQTDPASPS